MTHRFLAGFTGVALAAAVFASSSHAASFLIDDFNVDQSTHDLPIPGFLPGPNEVAGPTTSILGGARDAFLDSNATGFNNANFRSGEDAPADNLFDFGSLSNNSGINGLISLVWDGLDGDAIGVDEFGLGGLDISDGGSNARFTLDLLSADLPGATFDLTVFDMSGNSGTVTNFVNSSFSNSDPVELLHFNFADFGGVEMDNVGAIRLDAYRSDGFGNRTNDLDMKFDDLRTTQVPVPAGIVLLGGGMVVLGATRKLRKA